MLYYRCQKELDKEAERILDHRVPSYSKTNKRMEYLVQWKGQPELEATWEKESNSVVVRGPHPRISAELTDEDIGLS